MSELLGLCERKRQTAVLLNYGHHTSDFSLSRLVYSHLCCEAVGSLLSVGQLFEVHYRYSEVPPEHLTVELAVAQD